MTSINQPKRRIRLFLTSLATLGGLSWTMPAMALHINNPGFPFSGLQGGTTTIAGNVLTTTGSYNPFSAASAPLSHGAPIVSAANLNAWADANPGRGNSYAMVDPAHQTLRSSSAVASMANKLVENKNAAVFHGTEILVGAGNSGLSLGAPVQLRFDLRVDGTQSVSLNNNGLLSIAPETYSYGATAYAELLYRVYDLDVDNETSILDFEYVANMVYAVSRTNASHALTDYRNSSASYMLNNSGPWVSVHYEAENHSNGDISNIGVPGLPPDRTTSYDTGVVSIIIDTLVGHTLMINADLITSALGYGIEPMKALSDYGNTFDADIVSLTSGIELIGIAADPTVAQVPEPGSALLLLTGLALVGGIGRRKSRDLA